ALGHAGAAGRRGPVRRRAPGDARRTGGGHGRGRGGAGGDEHAAGGTGGAVRPDAGAAHGLGEDGEVLAQGVKRAANRPPYIRVMRHEARTLSEQVQARSGPLDTPCRVFTGAVNSRGEPVARASGRTLPATLVALALAGAPVSRKTEVVRGCWTPRCVAVEHLEARLDRRTAAGTPFRREGTRRPRTRLSPEQVLEIRRRHVEEGASPSDLARDYAVDRGAVTRMLQGRTWRSVTGGADVYVSSREAAYRRARRCEELHQRGWTQREIAEELSVVQSAVSQYLTGRNAPRRDQP